MGSDYNKRLTRDGAIGGALGAAVYLTVAIVTGDIPVYLLPIAIPPAFFFGAIAGIAKLRLFGHRDE